MKCRLVTLIFLILLVASCAGGKSHITHEVVKPDGAPFPNPYYVLQTTNSNRPMRLSFFYSSIKWTEDLDGKKVPTVKYLDRRERHYFMADYEDGAKIVARVRNPTNVRYKVFIKQTIKFSDGGEMDAYSNIGYSDMIYREFDQSLPLWEGIKEVTFSFELCDEAGRLMVSTGKFNYYVSQ